VWAGGARGISVAVGVISVISAAVGIAGAVATGAGIVVAAAVVTPGGSGAVSVRVDAGI